MFRLEVTAAVLPDDGAGGQVKFQVVGACRAHQVEIRRQVATAFPTCIAQISTEVRPDRLGAWAAQARKELALADGLRRSRATQR